MSSSIGGYPTFPPPPPGGSAPRPDPQPEPTGPAALAWGLGLVVLVCVPFVSSVAASIAMAVTGRSAWRVSSGPVAESGRRAANWGLTYLVLTVVLVGSHFGLLFALGEVEGFYPFGIIITVWGGVTLFHLVVCIVGLTRASSRRVVRVPAIPFVR